MAFVGADTGKLRDLAQLMKTDANKLQEIIPVVSGTLRSSPWHGPDRSSFDYQWSNQLMPQLRTVAQQLVEAAETAQRNAEAQDRASARDGESSFGGGGGGFNGAGASGSWSSGNEDSDRCEEPDQLSKVMAWLDRDGKPAKDLDEWLGNFRDGLSAAGLYLTVKAGKFAPRDVLGRFERFKNLPKLKSLKMLSRRLDATEYVSTQAKNARLLVKSGKVLEKISKGLNKVAKAAGIVSFVVDAANEYKNDSSGKSSAERLTNSVVVAGVKTAGSLMGAKAGAAVGAALGAPLGPLGMVVGSVAGSYLGSLGGETVAKWGLGLFGKK